jgi:fluoroacetyl-CoA thioesterase
MTDSTSPPEPAPLAPGLTGTLESIVRMEWTRANFEPHFPAVFSTPAMIGLMEGAIANAVAPRLAENTFTVGTRVEVDHLKAIPVGAPVLASARLVEIQGRHLIFEVEAHSNELLIGRGRIHHTIVDLARFHRIASPSDAPPQDRR